MSLKKYLKRLQWPVIWSATYALSVIAMLWWRLGTIPKGAAPAEIDACQVSGSWTSVFSNIADAPYLILQNLLPGNCSPDHQFWLRLPATLIALAAGALFVIAIKRWLGKRAAWLAGILFLTSSWFLHAGRLSVPSVSLLLVIPLILFVYQRTISSPHSRLSGLIVALSAGLISYIPGAIWFVIATTVLAYKPILKYLKQRGWIVSSLLIFSWLALLTPLAMSLVKHPSQLTYWLGLPIDWSLSVIWHILLVPVNIFVYGPGSSLNWLGHLPILDIFTSGMAVLGLVWLFRHVSKQRRMFVIVTIAIAWLLAGFRSQGVSSLNLIVPLFYFFAAVGIQAMFRKWFAVFPRNPFAKWLAYALIIAVILFAVIYNLRAYYIAWPHSQAVIDLFYL